MKVALVHDFLTSYGGAERFLYSLHQVFPDAPIITSSYTPDALPDFFPKDKVLAVRWTQNPLFRKFSKQLTFLYSYAFEALDLGEFDVIISSSANYAKGVVTHSRQLHINYCHTPPRFLYKYEGESSKRDVWYYVPFVAVIDSYLRVWDYMASQRVDVFVANSQNTARRIRKFYGRDSTVIYPPNNVVAPNLESVERQNYYLLVSRLAAYKHIELAVHAFNRLRKKLVIVGIGPEREYLQKLSGPTIEWRGFVEDKDLARLYTEAKALIYTARDEDFGLTPIEAMSYGTPVIGHASGGLLETIVPGTSGIFFDTYSVAGLVDGIVQFEKMVFDHNTVSKSVEKFSQNNFSDQIRTFVSNQWELYNQ